MSCAKLGLFRILFLAGRASCWSPQSPPSEWRPCQFQRPQVERPSAVWTSYAQCNRQCQLFRVSRVMKLLKTSCVAGCDWTANGRRSRQKRPAGACATGLAKREFGSCPVPDPISSRSRPSGSSGAVPDLPISRSPLVQAGVRELSPISPDPPRSPRSPRSPISPRSPRSPRSPDLRALPPSSPSSPFASTPVCIVSRSRPSKSPASDSGRQSTGASAMIYGSAVSSRPSRRHRTTLPTPGLLRSRRLPA